MKTPRRHWMLALLAGSSLAPALAHGADVAQIGGNALGNASGSIEVNVAAGAGNAQANATALAVGHDASATTTVSQQTRAAAATGQYSALIGGGALAHAAGLVSINEVAGSGNAQANTIAIAIGLGGTAVSSNQLSQVVGGSVGPTAGSPQTHHVGIQGAALSQATGLVQVNQTAGTGNSSANHFALEMNLGTKP